MNQEEYDDTRQIWALTHASLDFDQVQMICDTILLQKLNSTQSIYTSLITSIYVVYGRPFKSNEKMKISDSLVPDSFRGLHKDMIEHRDKIYAHTDKKGLPLGDGLHIHEVGVEVDENGRARLFITKMWTQPILVERIKDLAVAMRTSSTEERNKLMVKHERHLPRLAGRYSFNVTDMNGPIINPSRIL